MHVALVAGSLRPTGALDGKKDVTVSADRMHAALAARVAAAAGLRATIVPPGQASDFVLLTSYPKPSKATSASPALLFYDDAVLSALLPGASISVGSLAQLMPEVDWVTDPGGMVLTVPYPEDRPARAVVPPPARAIADSGPLVVKVKVMPKRPVGVRGPVTRVALDGPEIRGVKLRPGDIVVDQAGARWFFVEGSLWSHRVIDLRRDSVLVEGRTVRPQLSGTALPAAKGDRVEMRLAGPRPVTVYGVVAETPADGTWTVRADVDAAMVSDPRAFCFGARLASSAAECYAAGGVWDRPCDRDTECPYFDPRTGRGGCVSGMCEMPLGVGNLSFRVPDPATPPLCDTDDDSPWCRSTPKI